MNKKKLRKVAPAALAFLCIFAGASAYLSTIDIDNHTHSIEAGTFALAIENESEYESESIYGLFDDNALPTTKDYVLENVTPYTVSVRNDGTIAQAVRFAITDVADEAFIGDDGALPADKINLLVLAGDADLADLGDDDVLFEGTLADANGELGFGPAAVLAGESEADADDGGVITVQVLAWIDSSATENDIYEIDTETGEPDTTSPLSIAFRLEVLGVQADGEIVGGELAPMSAYTAEQFEEAAGNAELTRTILG